MAHPQQGRVLIERIVNDLQTVAIVEQMPRMEGRNMFLMLAAKPQK
jgi:translation initiation factor IF-3